eukprot:scaffold135802_cov31-Tisochrysis_lutea.AAC.3
MELNRKFQHKMGATVEALQISDVRVHSMSKVIGARDASRAGAPVGVGSDSLMSVVLTFRWRLPRLLIIGTEPDDCVSCFSGRAARRFSECHRDFDCNEAKHHEVQRGSLPATRAQVTFATNMMVAQQTMTQTVALANGTAKSRLETAAANAKMTEQTVGAEINAFLNVSRALGLAPKEVLDYIWWDQIETGKDTAKEFLVGINPAAYIQQTGSRRY